MQQKTPRHLDYPNNFIDQPSAQMHVNPGVRRTWKKNAEFSEFLEDWLKRNHLSPGIFKQLVWHSSCEINRSKRSFDSSNPKMRIGRESAYAIEGLLALAAKPRGTVMLLRDIADSRDLPRSFLAKIFQKLARCGIVVSSRGTVRGYALARRKRETNVKEILIAVEGPDLFNQCILWRDRCVDTNPCALHSRWNKAREEIINELMERTTLADLAKDDNPRLQDL